MATETRISNPARWLKSPPAWAAIVLAPVLGGSIAAAGDASSPAPVPQARAIASTPAAAHQVAQADNVAAPQGPAAFSGSGSASGSGAARTAHRGAVGCLIGPERTADIGSPVTGVIAAIRVERGDAVHKGQVLALLEQDVERANWQAAVVRSGIDADLRSAEANYALARERHERMASLVDTGAIAALSIEQARAEQDVAQQRVEQARGQQKVSLQELGVARAQLAQRTLKAPFDGVIVERLTHEGERVEDRPLLRIAQLDPLRVELVMPATRWGTVQVREPLMILPELPGAKPVEATVTHVDRMLDAASNTFRVRLSLPNPQHRLPAGARCRLEGAPGVAADKAAAPPAPAASGAAPASLTRAPAGARVQPTAWTPPAAPTGMPRLRLTI